ncbi:hypothetical protein DFJ43DRAFT_29113 [Lentinula guzmanii]|uniref:Uncharacterized protein n=1 Tax=Lentinula guzmanii TaxID=2804957 RepID=A0AA38N568_9AGAR|nr:hypothetical protein DFJ43DRAFT_29113 [Lentinula guzmanii]
MMIPPPIITGLVLYVVGITLVWYSEIQRTQFIEDPQKRGHVYTHGLLSYARHMNQTGDVCWRVGSVLASAGWGRGLFNF